MTEQQATTPRIPPYAHGMRIAATNEAREAEVHAQRKEQAEQELAAFEEFKAREHDRIEGELREAQARAQSQLNNLATRHAALEKAVNEAARAHEQHKKDAEGAKASWLDWCAREGVDPRHLPPIPEPQAPVQGTPPGAVPALTPCFEAQPDCDNCTGDGCGHHCHADRAAEHMAGLLGQPLPGGEGPNGLFHPNGS